MSPGIRLGSWNSTSNLCARSLWKPEILTTSKRIDLCIENLNCNLSLSAAPCEIWIRRDVFYIPDKRNCIIVWPNTWKTTKQQKLRISDDIIAQKCWTLPSSLKWNKIGKQTSESHLIFHLGMKLEPTPPNGYWRAGWYLMAITWAAHRVLCSWARPCFSIFFSVTGKGTEIEPSPLNETR